jgi:hypothetical protein
VKGEDTSIPWKFQAVSQDGAAFLDKKTCQCKEDGKKGKISV